MLSALKLSQFRCFDSLRLELAPGMTAFIGANAQGKTSILEAVCVLLRLQSPRTSSLNDLIQFEQSGFGLAGTWDGQELRVVNEVRRRRKLYHHDNELPRGAEYLEQSGLVVWMGNDDLTLITGSGSRRRRYLDFQASQLYA
ncbi:MAG: AAA family ATPase, partial [Verrucomicrobiales bacterium]